MQLTSFQRRKLIFLGKAIFAYGFLIPILLKGFAGGPFSEDWWSSDTCKWWVYVLDFIQSFIILYADSDSFENCMFRMLGCFTVGIVICKLANYDFGNAGDMSDANWWICSDRHLARKQRKAVKKAWSDECHRLKERLNSEKDETQRRKTMKLMENGGWYQRYIMRKEREKQMGLLLKTPPPWWIGGDTALLVAILLVVVVVIGTPFLAHWWWLGLKCIFNNLEIVVPCLVGIVMLVILIFYAWNFYDEHDY